MSRCKVCACRTSPFLDDMDYCIEHGNDKIKEQAEQIKQLKGENERLQAYSKALQKSVLDYVEINEKQEMTQQDAKNFDLFYDRMKGIASDIAK